MDEKVVQTTDTSATENVQKTPSPDEVIAQKLAEMEKRLESKFQSTKDKAVAEARREAERKIKEVESNYETLQKSLAGYDPNSGVDLHTFAELQTLRSKESLRQREETERKQREAIQRTKETFKSGMVKHAEALGVDPKSINWGTFDEEDIPDFATHQTKLLDQIGGHVKTKWTTLEERLKKLEKPPEESNDSVSDVGVTPSATQKKLTIEQVKKMSPAERIKRNKEIASMDLTL